RGSVGTLHRVNDDAPSAERLGAGGVNLFGSARHVVVHDRARGDGPNFDAELIHAASAVHLPIRSGQQDTVIAAAMDRARASELRVSPCNDQPVVGGTVEVQVPGLELELEFSAWRGSARHVLRDETESGFPGESRVGRVSAGGRIDPAAASDKTCTRIID